MVHKPEDVAHVVHCDVPQHDDGVGRRIALEEVAEEVGAGRQDELVRVDLLAVADEGDVDKVLLVPEVLQGGEDALLEVVPPQAELLVAARAHDVVGLDVAAFLVVLHVVVVVVVFCSSAVLVCGCVSASSRSVSTVDVAFLLQFSSLHPKIINASVAKD